MMDSAGLLRGDAVVIGCLAVHKAVIARAASLNYEPCAVDRSLPRNRVEPGPGVGDRARPDEANLEGRLM